MSFVLGNSVRVLKVAVKKFSVRPCWSPILLKLQNSTAGVFQWVLKKILETFSTEQQRIAAAELKKEGGNIGHQLFYLTQELQKSFRKNKVQIF